MNKNSLKQLKMDDPINTAGAVIDSFDDLASCADYSLMRSLNCDPEASQDGLDHSPRQVFTGHYVPVKPSPIGQPDYIAHSKTLFSELGYSDALVHDADFVRMFTGDLPQHQPTLRPTGWACGYALSIFGTEYTQQCPFQTGNGYGDGRAISVFEGLIAGNRWELQLKGAGRTPYCRGADGRAVLRSSIREFLAQEHMHALGIPTSRSLCLFVSKSDSVNRPWYADHSVANDPDRIVSEPVAITTRAASSFLRIGQLELFSRRAREQSHPEALAELKMILGHVIEREYASSIDQTMPFEQQLLALAEQFRDRLSHLVAQWIRVGYCQGNFNSDNCAVGGFTLDYGPFGFMELFDPYYQPWTGGGRHFSFLAQPIAAERNFKTFCTTLHPLLADQPAFLAKLNDIAESFADVMKQALEHMWASKLGLAAYSADIFHGLMRLLLHTPTDFTLFFRELSTIPKDISALEKSFYRQDNSARSATDVQHTDNADQWAQWLENWRSHIDKRCDSEGCSVEQISAQMKQVNPKYTWREWCVVPAYQRATQCDYSLVHDIQHILNMPYDEQTAAVEARYYQKKPPEYFNVGGVSHYSCSS